MIGRVGGWVSERCVESSTETAKLGWVGEVGWWGGPVRLRVEKKGRRQEKSSVGVTARERSLIKPMNRTKNTGNTGSFSPLFFAVPSESSLTTQSQSCLRFHFGSLVLSPFSINLNTSPSPSRDSEPIALSSRNSNNCLAPTPVFALSLWLYPTVPPLTQHQSSVAQVPPTVESYCLKSSPCPTSPGWISQHRFRCHPSIRNKINRLWASSINYLLFYSNYVN